MADATTRTTLRIPTNSGGEVCFTSIADAASFANINARRVSNTLEVLAKSQSDESQLAYALELLTDVAFQVAGAVEHLADAIEAGSASVQEANHG